MRFTSLLPTLNLKQILKYILLLILKLCNTKIISRTISPLTVSRSMRTCKKSVMTSITLNSFTTKKSCSSPSSSSTCLSPSLKTRSTETQLPMRGSRYNVSLFASKSIKLFTTKLWAATEEKLSISIKISVKDPRNSWEKRWVSSSFLQECRGWTKSSAKKHLREDSRLWMPKINGTSFSPRFPRSLRASWRGRQVFLAGLPGNIWSQLWTRSSKRERKRWKCRRPSERFWIKTDSSKKSALSSRA